MTSDNRHSRKNKRESLSKSIRFEVFKRDSFTCQYCGKSAPNVVLHVDHIKPVAENGKNDLLNLITSCMECNSGKGKRQLKDNSVIAKQKSQLDDLNERRIQLEMLIEYRQSLSNIADMALDRASDLILSLTGFSLNDSGRRNLKKVIKEFGINETLDAIETSSERYLVENNDGGYTTQSFEAFFGKISGICFVRKKDRELPGYEELTKIKSILRRRFPYTKLFDAMQYLEKAYRNGISIEWLRDLANEHRAWADMRAEIDNLLDKKGRK